MRGRKRVGGLSVGREGRGKGGGCHLDGYVVGQTGLLYEEGVGGGRGWGGGGHLDGYVWSIVCGVIDQQRHDEEHAICIRRGAERRGENGENGDEDEDEEEDMSMMRMRL